MDLPQPQTTNSLNTDTATQPALSRGMLIEGTLDEDDHILSFSELLEGSRFFPYPDAPHPFYVVQLSSRGEKRVQGALASDAIADHVRCEAETERPYTHIMVQTHGWNTAPDAAVRMPFSKFIGGMLNDKNIPTDSSFRPLFVCFTWDSLPLSFIERSDATSFNGLLNFSLAALDDQATARQRSIEYSEGRSSLITALKETLLALLSDDDDDDNIEERNSEDDSKLSKLCHLLEKMDEVRSRSASRSERRGRFLHGISHIANVIGDTVFDAIGDVAELAGDAFKERIADPIHYLVFGRLMRRARRTGQVLGEVIAKLMWVAGDAQFNITGHSLGVQVVCGVIGTTLPHKMHSAFLVQGAADASWFGEKGRFEEMTKIIAGPIVCTKSKHDRMLSNVFGAFNAPAVGIVGFPQGAHFRMKHREELKQSPYDWSSGEWYSVDGSAFIDDGGLIEGGHGDFKEDETTMTYWSIIKANVEEL